MMDTPFIFADEMFRSYSEEETDELWQRLTSDEIGVGKNRGLFFITKKKHIFENYSADQRYTIADKKIQEIKK
jgi:hypothetical protein